MRIFTLDFIATLNKSSKYKLLHTLTLMEHTSENFTLDFTQKNQDLGFVAQMLMATNAIPYESIQFQTLENTNSYSKKMERCFHHSIF